MKHGPLEITLRAMRFEASVGILPEERRTLQPVEIDITVSVDAGDTIVDYGALQAVAASVLSAGHIDYLEEVAERVASGALAVNARISRARIAVRKPKVRLAGPLDYAEVAVDRTRDSRG